MEMLTELYWTLEANWDNILIILFSLWTAAEAITRITPTETDDGAVTRVGQKIDAVLAKLTFLPNNVKRKSGSDAFKK